MTKSVILLISLLAVFPYKKDSKLNEIKIPGLAQGTSYSVPYYAKQALVQLPLASLGIHAGQTVKVVDLITGNSYHWDKEWNFVELHPALPFHLFKIYK